jgi:hypothetical protein
VASDKKIVAEEKIVPARRVGEDTPGKNHEAKTTDPDLRKRICDNGPCKEPESKPAPESDLRRHICVTGNCACPAGQVSGKNGCVAAAESVAELQQQCSTAGTQWNGTNCVNTGRDCANYIGQGAVIASELRSIKSQMQMACSNDPYGQECNEAKTRQDGARTRYEGLLTSTPLACRSQLPDEASLL